MTEEGGGVVERRMAILPQLTLLCLILCEYILGASHRCDCIANLCVSVMVLATASTTSTTTDHSPAASRVQVNVKS